MEWQIVYTQIRLLLKEQTAPVGAVWSGSAIFAYATLSEALVYKILVHLPYNYVQMTENAVSDQALDCLPLIYLKYLAIGGKMDIQFLGQGWYGVEVSANKYSLGNRDSEQFTQLQSIYIFIVRVLYFLFKYYSLQWRFYYYGITLAVRMSIRPSICIFVSGW